MNLFPGTLNIHLLDCKDYFPKDCIRLEKEEYGGTVSIQISLVSVIYLYPNLSNCYPILASTKPEKLKESEPKIDYEKSNHYHNIGIAHGLRGELDEALENYTKAIAFNPKNATAYLNRGTIYLSQSKWDLALRDHNRAIELDPKISGRAYFNRATIYNLRNQWDKAIADYDLAIEQRANYHQAYFNRGIVYLKQENWNDAIQDFERVIELIPENDQAYFNLGFAYIKLQQWHEARARYDRGIAINPRDGKAYYNRGIIYAKTGNRVKAIADWQKARDVFLKVGDLLNYQNVQKLLKQHQQPSLLIHV